MSEKFSVAVKIKAIDEVSQVLSKVTSNITRQSTSSRGLNSWVMPDQPFKSVLDSIRGLNFSGFKNSLPIKRFLLELKEGTRLASQGFSHLGSMIRSTLCVLTTTGLAFGGVSFLSRKMFSEIASSEMHLKNKSILIGMSKGTLETYRSLAKSVGAQPSAMDSALSRISEMALDFKRGNTASSQIVAALNAASGGGRISLLNGKGEIRSAKFHLTGTS